MTVPSPLPHLDRLEGYLRQDPDNPSLLADTFDTALAAGELSRAEFPLRHAQRLGGGVQSWGWREAHWLMASHRWLDAEHCLRHLLAAPELSDDMRAALTHDLAHVAWRRGEFEAGEALLSPYLSDVPATRALDARSQALWLRLLHQTRRYEQACAWADARWTTRALVPEAAGVASLIALDAEDAPRSLRWSDFALEHDEFQLEALVARATIALGQNDPVMSRRLLDRALQRNVVDGRILSTLAFTDLLEQRIDAAHENFQKAVIGMPEHIGTWHGLGWTRLLMNDLPGARQAFASALALNRNFSENHGGMAIVMAFQHQVSEAQRAIEVALRLDRNSVSALYAQSILNGEARDMKAIRRLARKVLQSRPGMLEETLLDEMLPGAKKNASD
jgi:Tfp pilus assembly protein PilF